MTTSFARPMADIDAELHSCRTVHRDAHRELAVLRRRRRELAELEAELAMTIRTCSARADRLLDERLHAAVPAPASRPECTR